MSKAKVSIDELKSVVGSLSIASDKSKINQKANWMGLSANSNNNTLSVEVCGSDYYFKTIISLEECSSDFKVVIFADTFISLIGKFGSGAIDMDVEGNTLVLSTNTNKYTFPFVFTNEGVATINTMDVDNSKSEHHIVKSADLCSISKSNANGLIDAVFKKKVQQYIYVDNIGAITYTENIYVNDFKNKYDSVFRILLNFSQCKLLDLFRKDDNVNIYIEKADTDKNIRIKLSNDSGSVFVVMETQSLDVVNTFPYDKIRNFASNTIDVHAVVDRIEFSKALDRIMVFDKKFDVSVLDYSRFEFGANSVKLVSVKNNNYEIVKYDNGLNTSEYSAIIRFADVVRQLKAIDSDKIDISYGNGSAIVINGNIKQLIPEVVSKKSN